MPTSDGTTARPSPVLVTAQRSSTADVVSSPARMTTAPTPPAMYQPSDKYVSILESQARRKISAQILSDETTAKEVSDEDFDSEGSYIRRRRRRQKQEEKARAELSAIGASLNRRQNPSPSLRPNATASRKRPLDRIQDVVILSDDPAIDDNITEEETEREEDIEEVPSDSSIDELAEDNKENIAAFGVQVPRTTLKTKIRRELATAPHSTPSHRATRRTSAVPALLPSNSVRDSSMQGSSESVADLPATNEDPAVVVDSQVSLVGQRSQPAVSLRTDARVIESNLEPAGDFVPASQPIEKEEPKASQNPTNALITDSRDRAGQEQPPVTRSNMLSPAREAQRRGDSLKPAPDASLQLPRGINQTGSSNSSGGQSRDLKILEGENHVGKSMTHQSNSVIPDSKSTPSTRRPDNSSTSVRITEHTTTAENSHTRLSTGVHSTVFETAPSSIKKSPTKPVENALQSSSPVMAYVPRRQGQRAQRALESSPESTRTTPRALCRTIAAPPSTSPVTPTKDNKKVLAKDASEDELAMSTPPTSSPLSSAKSVDDLVPSAALHPGDTSKHPDEPYSTLENGHCQRTACSGHANLVRNRVLAHFNGKVSAYYPATCTQIIRGEETRYQIHFDDGSDDIVNAYGVKNLEFKPGDLVKVDAKEYRKYSYIVEAVHNQEPSSLFCEGRGVSPRESQEQQSGRSKSTDVFGNTSVTVLLKSTGSEVAMEHLKKLVVPIDRIYVTPSMWGSYKDRTFTFTNLDAPKPVKPHTPSVVASDVTTPTSRSVRTKAVGVVPSRPISSLQATRSPIFRDIVFAITNVSSEEARKITRVGIQSHGGTIIESRFDDLFHVPQPYLLKAEGLKKDVLKSEKEPEPASESHSLKLRPEATNIRFACVVADRHCRMPKYIQALALGVPCLSRRWISDSVAEQQLLPWTPYLLAAGESAYLYDAVISRSLQSFSSHDASLAMLIDGRPRLLQGQNLLLIMSKREEETMKHMPLISHALGANKVLRVNSAEEAIRVLIEARRGRTTWHWVYSHQDSERVKKLFSGKASSNSKRGRFHRELGAVPRVVGNEFIIQSLIAGRLVDGL